MSFISKIGSAIGKLVIVGVLVAAFFAGMAFVVYRSLQGSEVQVPEMVGKNFSESEKELEALGLKIKKRADRYSEEPPNTVLEQIPHAGDTVKTGQLILVVTSKPNPEGDEKPTTLKKGNQTTEEDDSKKIEELISDQPKKKNNSNSNTNKKKASGTRDVISGNSNTGSGDSNSSKTPTDDNGGKENKDSKDPKDGAPPSKTPSTKDTPKPKETPKPAADSRPRRNPD